MTALLILDDRMIVNVLNKKLRQQRFNVFATACWQFFPTWCDDLEKIMLTPDADLCFHLMPPR
jgi:hypothetical protein